jgi:hypothetical protein
VFPDRADIGQQAVSSKVLLLDLLKSLGLVASAIVNFDSKLLDLLRWRSVEELVARLFQGQACKCVSNEMLW